MSTSVGLFLRPSKVNIDGIALRSNLKKFVGERRGRACLDRDGGRGGAHTHTHTHTHTEREREREREREKVGDCLQETTTKDESF